MKRYMYVFKSHKINPIFLAFLAIALSLAVVVSTYFGGIFIDSVIEAESFESILWVCLILLGLSVIGLVLRFAISLISGPAVETLVYDLKQHLLRHLKKIQITEFKKFNPAYLSKRIEEDTRQFTVFFVDNYATVAIKAFELVIIGFLVFNINVFIGSLMLVLCPVYFFLYKVFKKSIFEKSLAAREKSSEFFQDYTYQLEYMEDIVMEADFDKEEKLLSYQFTGFRKKFIDYVKVNARLNFFQGLIVALMQVIIFFVGGLSVLRGHTTIGLLSILMAYFSQMLNNISYYVEMARKYQINKSAIYRMNEIMNMTAEKGGTHKLNQIDSIDANVNYTIDGKQILDGIELCAEKGKVIGVMGANGAGKSTLMKILVGVIRVQGNNSIVFNRIHDANGIDLAYCRKIAVSYVPQKIEYRDLTIGEVLSAKKMFKGAQDFLEFMTCKKIPIYADIAEFIMANWDKKANKLSGGDKQMIAILQSLVKNSTVMIFDEPTSNLDASRVAWFKDMIISIKSEKLIFIVSHEDNTIYFDSIITINSSIHDLQAREVNNGVTS